MTSLLAPDPESLNEDEAVVVEQSDPHDDYRDVPGVSVLNDMEDSHGRPEDLTGSQIASLRALFEDRSGLGLYMFAYHVCGAQDLYAPLHLEMCSFLSMWGEVEVKSRTGIISRVNRPPSEDELELDSWRRLMVAVPRDHFKTTMGTRCNGLWVVSLDPESTIGIFNENEAKVKSWIGAIKNIILTSKLYHMCFPEVLPPGVHFMEAAKGIKIPRNWKWGDTGILLNRNSHMVAELSIEPFGIGGATAGKHFTHVIKDDIIGDKAAESEAVMNDAIEWVNHARALERPAENGCELFNFTRWGYYDVYSHVLKKWPNQYKLYLRHMLEDSARNPDVVTGKVIFPTRFRTAQAKQMYREDPFVFMSQFMNIPMAGRETSFNAGWMRYGDYSVVTKSFKIDSAHYSPEIMHSDLKGAETSAPRVVTLEMLDRAILIDPAPSKKTERRAEPRARTALICVGKDPWGRNYQLDALPLREDPVEVLKSLVAMANKWEVYKVGIEEVNFSVIYAPLWERIMRNEFPDTRFQWISLKPGGRDKDTRILSLSGPMKEGFWYFNRATSGYVVQEFLEFPHGETKDLIDAMSYTEEVLARGATPDEAIFERRQRYITSGGRSARTGY